MSSKGKLIHKQQFQNAQQIIEVTIKSKPRAKLGLKTKVKSKENPFIRDCLLKQELEKLTREKEDKKQRVKKLKSVNQDRPMPKLKINQPKATVEIYKKKKASKKNDRKIVSGSNSLKSNVLNNDTLKRNDVLPPDMSWGKFLRSLNSSKSSISKCSTTDYYDSNNDPSLDGSSKFANKKVPDKNKPPDIPIQIEKYLNTNSHNLQNGNQKYNKFTGNYRPSKILDKSIQTSLQFTVNDGIPQNPSSSNKTIPKHVKNSTSQTHSPFGESALKILQHLRERLHSIGDNEGFEMVSALEAYFGSADKKPENMKIVEEGSSASPLFPPAFQVVNPTPQKDEEREKLKRIVSEQNKKLEEQEQSIEELKSLSMKLIAYNEQLSQHLIQETQNEPNNNLNSANPDKPQKKKEDSGIELSSSEDLMKTIKHLTSERDAMLREVRDQREVILNLEIKLSQVWNEFEDENVCRYGNEARPTSRQSTLNNKENRKPLKKSSVEVLREGVTNPSSGHLLHRTFNESEVDSAYEEKSSRSSRPSSKQSQFVNRNVYSKSEGNSFLSGARSVEPPKKSELKNYDNIKPILSDVGPYCNKKTNLTSSLLPFQPDTHWNYSQEKEIEAISSHKINMIEGDQLSIPKSNLSSNFLSDVSSDQPSYSLSVEGSYPTYRPELLESFSLSETPILAHPQRFLESTHMNGKQKPCFIPFEQTISRRKQLDPGFSTLESTSFEGTKCSLNSMLESCSSSNSD